MHLLPIWYYIYANKYITIAPSTFKNKKTNNYRHYKKHSLDSRIHCSAEKNLHIKLCYRMVGILSNSDLVANLT